MLWFVENLALLDQERRAVERLEDASDWLRGTDWRIDGGLCLDAVIRAHDHEYEVRMTYPELFPEVPPVVRPSNREESWSGHQYGDGSLCLEWGPDNWEPEVTGAQMIQSAHRLLVEENPKGSGASSVVPSRHALDLGQELRTKPFRFYAGQELLGYLAGLPDATEGVVDVHLRWQSKSLLIVVRRMRPDGTPDWEDPSVPGDLYASGGDGDAWTGVFYKTELPPEVFGAVETVRDVEELAGRAGRDGAVLSGAEGPYALGLRTRPRVALFVDAEDNPHLFLLLKEGKAFGATPVKSEVRGSNPRLPVGLEHLAGKSVGIVGLGSVGSKLAVSLARSGASRFVLADKDVFLPENLVRNDLDWRNVADHKVYGVEQRLRLVAPGVEVEVLDLHLTGQENNASVAGALRKLGGCDLLIDATADGRVFNLMAAVARRRSKPLVWLEVYGGGIGGMIARSRPNADPEPQIVRAAYHAYTSDAPDPVPKPALAYAAEDADGAPLAASDADVGVIAHHAARLAADALIEPEDSAYPHSVYLIGMARFWVFEAPFHTIPIATDHLPKKRGAEADDPDLVSENVGFLKGLLDG